MKLRSFVVAALGLTFVVAPFALKAQDEHRRGRKYKAPPATSHIEVLVLKDTNGKPVMNAGVVFRAYRAGRDEGNLEVKTNEEGKAVIDVIATGSKLSVQVIADGLATFAGDYVVDSENKDITIRMLKPRAQISTYAETHGEASARPAGVQEPATRATAPVLQNPKPTNHTSDPNPLAPVSPNATPGNSQNGTPGNPPGVPPQP